MRGLPLFALRKQLLRFSYSYALSHLLQIIVNEAKRRELRHCNEHAFGLGFVQIEATYVLRPFEFKRGQEVVALRVVKIVEVKSVHPVDKHIVV